MTTSSIEEVANIARHLWSSKHQRTETIYGVTSLYFDITLATINVIYHEIKSLAQVESTPSTKESTSMTG